MTCLQLHLQLISPTFPHYRRHVTTASLRRHHRRRRNFKNPITQSPPSSDSNNNLQILIDMDYLTLKPPISLKTHFQKLTVSAAEALEDLRTLIIIDPDNKKVKVSCRKSSIQFVGNLFVWGLVVVLGFRVLVKLRDKLLLGFGRGGNGVVITRRDRSLGGREVVVGKREESRRTSRFLGSPVSETNSGDFGGGVFSGMRKEKREKKKLPDWWPDSSSVSVVGVDEKEEYQRQANRLIREIMDYRMSGKDVWMDDIVQLRQICRVSGVSVSINTANSRDSLYRASVDFVLNICGSVPSPSAFVQIIGENAREFIAGLADNIGLEKYRAARMVNAAVAARTRSWILQAWALEMQGKHSEAVAELSKLSLTHQIFPPEESSPEMEMVARGLEKNLKLEQREHLMNMLIEVCGEGNCRSMAEALGLMIPPEGTGRQLNKYIDLESLQ